MKKTTSNDLNSILKGKGKATCNFQLHMILRLELSSEEDFHDHDIVMEFNDSRD